MTRINIGIKPVDLCKKHLLAEHREIIRIPNQIKSGRLKSNGTIPESFRLGQGHVRFFINKQLYLKNRYLQLYEDCLRRNCNVQDYSSCWDEIPENLMNDYEPTDQDIILIKSRIEERLKEMNKSKIKKNGKFQGKI